MARTTLQFAIGNAVLPLARGALPDLYTFSGPVNSDPYARPAIA